MPHWPPIRGAELKPLPEASYRAANCSTTLATRARDARCFAARWAATGTTLGRHAMARALLAEDRMRGREGPTEGCLRPSR